MNWVKITHSLIDPGGLKDYSEAAWKNYYNILKHPLPFLREEGHHISSKSKEVDEIKKVIESQERHNSETSGSGLKTIFLPSNLNKLFDRHWLLIQEYINTGVYNEIQAINDRLFKNGIISSQDMISFQKNILLWLFFLLKWVSSLKH